jgi:hypothetical protein
LSSLRRNGARDRVLKFTSRSRIARGIRLMRCRAVGEELN